MAKFWFLILSLKLVLILGQDEEPTVTIPDGTLVGISNQTVGKNTTYYAFRGIPYAQPPIGDLRFASPVENDPWTGILDATQDGDICVQGGTSLLLGGTSSSTTESEDCLFINVYTTNLELNNKLPVMVFIHGGGFTSGSSSYEDYAPDLLLEKNVIYVSFNYRLGVLGFLSTEDYAATGNWGLKDQILALKWVQTNIKYFGGDPKKVTIFGQSAGSASVSYLLQSRLTTGLFRGAMMESGTSLCQWALSRNARTKAFTVGEFLGINVATSQELITSLRQLDYAYLVAAQANVSITAYLSDGVFAGLPFGVVREPFHFRAVLWRRSYQLLTKGWFQKVPVVLGFNSNEGGLLQYYVSSLLAVLVQYDLNLSKLAPYYLTTNDTTKLEAGAVIRNKYFSSSTLIAYQAAKLVTFFNVDQFTRATRETARLLSAYTDVYLYEFSYKGLLGSTSSLYLGASHSDELNYLFANRGSANEQDSTTADKFVTLWTNFVKHLIPTPPVLGSSLGNLTWVPNIPGDDTGTTIKYLDVNTEFSMETNPDQTNWEFYQIIYGTYGTSRYSTY